MDEWIDVLCLCVFVRACVLACVCLPACVCVCVWVGVLARRARAVLANTIAACDCICVFVTACACATLKRKMPLRLLAAVAKRRLSRRGVTSSVSLLDASSSEQDLNIKHSSDKNICTKQPHSWTTVSLISFFADHCWSKFKSNLMTEAE